MYGQLYEWLTFLKVKCSLKHFLSDSMSLAGCQINLIDVIFHHKIFWKFLINIQLTKSDPKRTRKGGKCPPSCQFGLKYQITVEKLEQIAMLILMKKDQILQFYNYETAPHFN